LRDILRRLELTTDVVCDQILPNFLQKFTFAPRGGYYVGWKVTNDMVLSIYQVGWRHITDVIY